jgi:IS5 family transposase
MHANTDEDGFVKKMTYTPGNVHDSKEFDKLLGINRHKNIHPSFKIMTHGNKLRSSFVSF